MFGELGNEIFNIIIWYGVFLLLGVATLPLINKYFSEWKDKGYGISKFIGLAIVTLPLWFLSNFKIIPFTQTTVIFFLVGYIGLSVWYAWKTKYTLTRSTIKIIIFEEILFLLIFMLWTFIRSTNSQVEGTEKMMNIAFMNSIFRSEYFPVVDPWYYGGYINYYHIGHYMFTFVSKLTNIPISFAYNFALNTIAGFSFIATFSIIIKLINSTSKAKLKGSIFAGLLGASWMCFGANFHYLYKWIEAVFSSKTFEYWFPEGTRIITNVIDEFPGYSIPLGDLHGHYLGMPFLIIMIALLIVSYEIKIGTKEKIRFNLTISILVCVLYGINSWDFITTIFMFSVVHAYQVFITYKKWQDRILVFLVTTASLLVIGCIFLIPYLINFHPPVGGIGIVPIGQTSEILPWIQMWGTFVLITFMYFLTRTFWHRNLLLRIISLFGLSLVFLIPIIGKVKSLYTVEGFMNFKLVDNYQNLIGDWIVAIISIAVFISLLLALFKFLRITIQVKADRYETFVNLMLFVCFALLLGVEILFVQDIFYRSNPPYFRTNTVFKFYYHTWIIWAILCSYFSYKIFDTYLSSKSIKLKVIGSFLSYIIIILYIGSIAYAFDSIRDFYPFLKYDNNKYASLQELTSADAGDHIKIYDSIDGNDYIKDNHPGDYALMQWFNKNVQGRPTVVEAVGEAYSYYSRFSSNIGVVSIMGWPTHEWQWRSNTVAKVGDAGSIVYEDKASVDAFARKDEVEQIYTTTSLEDLKGLIAKYNVEYIIVGELERDAYKDKINEALISKVSGKIYDELNTKLYKVVGI